MMKIFRGFGFTKEVQRRTRGTRELGCVINLDSVLRCGERADLDRLFFYPINNNKGCVRNYNFPCTFYTSKSPHKRIIFQYDLQHFGSNKHTCVGLSLKM